MKNATATNHVEVLGRYFSSSLFDATHATPSVLSNTPREGIVVQSRRSEVDLGMFRKWLKPTDKETPVTAVSELSGYNKDIEYFGYASPKNTQALYLLTDSELIQDEYKEMPNDIFHIVLIIDTRVVSVERILNKIKND